MYQTPTAFTGESPIQLLPFLTMMSNALDTKDASEANWMLCSNIVIDISTPPNHPSRLFRQSNYRKSSPVALIA